MARHRHWIPNQPPLKFLLPISYISSFNILTGKSSRVIYLPCPRFPQPQTKCHLHNIPPLFNTNLAKPGPKIFASFFQHLETQISSNPISVLHSQSRIGLLIIASQPWGYMFMSCKAKAWLWRTLTLYFKLVNTSPRLEYSETTQIL